MRFDGRQAGVEALLRSNDMREKMLHTVEVMRIEAERIAPVDTGQYAFDVNTDPGETGGFDVSTHMIGGAWVGRLSNTTHYAPYLEFGWTTRNGRQVPGQHILLRSIDAIRG